MTPVSGFFVDENSVTKACQISYGFSVLLPMPSPKKGREAALYETGKSALNASRLRDVLSQILDCPVHALIAPSWSSLLNFLEDRPGPRFCQTPGPPPSLCRRGPWDARTPLVRSAVRVSRPACVCHHKSASDAQPPNPRAKAFLPTPLIRASRASTWPRWTKGPGTCAR